MAKMKFNILREKNFLEKKVYDYFLNFFLHSPFFEDKTSRALYGEEHYLNNGCIEFNENISVYNKKVLDTLTNNYGVDLLNVSGTVLRKWYADEYQDPHADCEAVFTINDGKVDSKPFNNFSSLFIDYAALLYLNDEYDGGEIFFPEHGIAIKPEPNEFIAFPGTINYLHGVNPIHSGNRFVMQGFYGSLKLFYLWQNFVIPDVKLSFVNKDELFYVENKTKYNRSNIPLKYMFDKV
jgi:hypothetical protein